jgi:hypothetical protein
MWGLFSSVIRSSMTHRHASKVATGLVLGFASIPAAQAGWVYGNVTEIQIYSENASTDRILVKGTFNTGCATPNLFVVAMNDNFFKEIFATLLTAKSTGTSIKYLHIYCMPDGISRGNAYAIAEQ